MDEISDSAKETPSKGVSSSETGNSPNEKADDDWGKTQMWIGELGTCVDVDYDCYAPVDIEDEPLGRDQDQLDDHIDNGTLTELDREVMENLFPDFSEQKISDILEGKTCLCKAKKENKTAYIAYKCDSDVSCQELKAGEADPLYVLQIENKVGG